MVPFLGGLSFQGAIRSGRLFACIRVPRVVDVHVPAIPKCGVCAGVRRRVAHAFLDDVNRWLFAGKERAAVEVQRMARARAVFGDRNDRRAITAAQARNFIDFDGRRRAGVRDATISFKSLADPRKWHVMSWHTPIVRPSLGAWRKTGKSWPHPRPATWRFQAPRRGSPARIWEDSRNRAGSPSACG